MKGKDALYPCVMEIKPWPGLAQKCLIPDRFVFKPWGSEEVIFECEETNTRVKILRINNGHRLSLQFHKEKTEMICLLRGQAKVHLSEDTIDFDKGRFIHIPPGVIHRFEGINKAELLEVSIGDDSDIVRLQDDYERTIKED